MTIWDAQVNAWRMAEDKGFHRGRGRSRDDTLVRLCLIHTEVSEAVQEVKRHWEGDGSPELVEQVGEELADVLIRVLDLAGCIGVDLQSAVEAKFKANSKRPHLYGTPAGATSM